MQTRLIGIHDLLPSEEQAWGALAERAIEPNPFFEPGFLVLASRRFEGFSKTRLLVVHEGPDFRAVLPIIGVERPRMPLRPTMATRGNPTMVSGMSTPLIDGACVDQATGALLDGLHRGAEDGELPGILSVQRIREYGPVINALRRESAARGMPNFTKESWVRGTVHRTGRWENPLTGERRRANARRRRGLAKDFGGEVRVVDRTLDPAAAADFVRMEASGWKGRGEGSAFGRDPAKVEWFQEWSDLWTGAGRVVVLSLYVGDTAVAMHYSILAGDGIFLYRIAHDESYAKYGPGALLLESVMERLLEQTDAVWIDSCTDPDNTFLLEILPEKITISMLLIGTGGMVDRIAVSAMPLMTRGVAQLQETRQRVAELSGQARRRVTQARGGRKRGSEEPGVERHLAGRRPVSGE